MLVFLSVNLTVVVFIHHGERPPFPELNQIPVSSTDSEIMRKQIHVDPLTVS